MSVNCDIFVEIQGNLRLQALEKLKQLEKILKEKKHKRKIRRSLILTEDMKVTLKHDDSILTERMETEKDLAKQVIREVTNENDSSAFKEESIPSISSKDSEEIKDSEEEKKIESDDNENGSSNRELINPL